MDYVLRQSPGSFSATKQEAKAKIIPPRRSHNLRAGGGRKDSPGWTEHKRRSNRRRFNSLRPYIKTAVTIIYPAKASPRQLTAFNECGRNFCREHRLPARCVWEGPGHHQHIALGIVHDPAIESRWRKRLAQKWQKEFNESMPPSAFLWKPDIEPDRIASYLLKTWGKGNHSGRLMVKAAFPWMTFAPTWEIGFRRLEKLPSQVHAPGKPRKNCVKSAAPSHPSHALSPSYTVSTGQTPEKEREICPVCWNRWGQSLWAGSCKCNPTFPDC